MNQNRSQQIFGRLHCIFPIKTPLQLGHQPYSFGVDQDKTSSPLDGSLSFPQICPLNMGPTSEIKILKTITQTAPNKPLSFREILQEGRPA
jgi:hypothetical protein